MSDAPTIMIVDDEPQMVGIVSYAFQTEGFKPLAAYDSYQALQLIQNHHIDLIILDIMLPGMDGLELCRQIRQDTNIPIVLMTVKDDQADIINGLEMGADDYITKPFSTRELILRVKAILRYARYTPKIIQVGPLTIDLLAHTVLLNQAKVSLSARQYDLLAHLAKNSGRVIGAKELLKEVWDLDVWEGGPEMVKVEIYRLRQKIEPAPQTPRFIQTVRGAGYRFSHDEPDDFL